jgi:phosphate transport system substrate-binding protein
MSKTGSAAGSTTRFVVGSLKSKRNIWVRISIWVASLALLVGVGCLGFISWQRMEALTVSVKHADSLAGAAQGRLFNLQKRLSGAGADARGDVLLRLHGSNTIGDELAPELARQWLASLCGTASTVHADSLHPESKRIQADFFGESRQQSVDVLASGSGVGFEHLRDRSCDIGMASRPIKDEDLEAFETVGMLDMAPPASEHVIALDAIAVVVHPGNPVTMLSMETLGQIFDGTITDWSQVPGGAQGPVHVLVRDKKSGTRSFFKEVALHGREFVANAREFGRHTDLVSQVLNDPSAIGFSSLPFVAKSKALALRDGSGPPVYPAAFAVRTEEYPLSRRLYLYMPAHSTHLLGRDFLEFCLGSAGQAAVAKCGFIPLGIEVAKGVVDIGKLPMDLAEVLKRSERLSCTFRFDKDGTLDSRGQRDLERLRQILSGDRAGGKVNFIGFCDSTGSPEKDLARSLGLAQKVLREFAQHNESEGALGALAGGPFLPTASNATPAGRERNKRVEVWIQPR